MTGAGIEAVSETVTVALGGRSYEVRIGKGLIDRAGRHVKPLLRRDFTVVVMDRTVADLHGERSARPALRAEGPRQADHRAAGGRDQELRRTC